MYIMLLASKCFFEATDCLLVSCTEMILQPLFWCVWMFISTSANIATIVWVWTTSKHDTNCRFFLKVYFYYFGQTLHLLFCDLKLKIMRKFQIPDVFVPHFLITVQQTTTTPASPGPTLSIQQWMQRNSAQ